MYGEHQKHLWEHKQRKNLIQKQNWADVVDTGPTNPQLVWGRSRRSYQPDWDKGKEERPKKEPKHGRPNPRIHRPAKQADQRTRVRRWTHGKLRKHTMGRKNFVIAIVRRVSAMVRRVATTAAASALAAGGVAIKRISATRIIVGEGARGIRMRGQKCSTLRLRCQFFSTNCFLQQEHGTSLIE